MLDGVPREIVRTRDTVRCYLPDARVVKVERRARRARLPGAAARAHQRRSRGTTTSASARRERIAGFDCQAVVLTPKDNLRYGYRLYADVDERHAAARP